MPGVPGAPNEGTVEGDEGGAGRSAAEVHGVGEAQALTGKFESSNHRCLVFDRHVIQAEQVRERLANRGLFESIGSTEEPSGPNQYGFRDPDWPSRNQGFRRQTAEGGRRSAATEFMTPLHFARNSRVHLCKGFRLASVLQTAGHVIVAGAAWRGAAESLLGFPRR